MMRTIISIVFSLCSWLSTSAQLTLSDILKGKHNVSEFSGNVVHEALIPELSIIRQQYRLKLKEDYYGKNNKPYYGEKYCLGVKVGGGLMFLSNIVKPWEGDADFERVTAKRKYQPELFRSYERGLRDSVFKAVELELYNSNYVVPVNTDSTLYLQDDQVSDFGLIIDDAAGKKSGYMVWTYTQTNVQDSAMNVTLRSGSYTVEARPDSMQVAMEPENPDKVLGGLFVIPKYERGGRAQMQLAGVAVRTKNGKWALQMLLNSEAKSAEKPQKAEAKESDDEPTPIKRKKK